MLRIATNTKLKPEEVINQALNFFGPSGYGLEIKEQSPNYAYFEGTDGYIEVSSYTDETVTSVELVSREWDYQAREFIKNIPHSTKKKTKT